MDIVFDRAKNQKNLAKHGLELDLIRELDWERAVIEEDNRQDYGEYRYRIFAPYQNALYSAVVTWRRGKLRGISIRKASAKERKRYEKENQ